jgi:hypothetical protein
MLSKPVTSLEITQVVFDHMQVWIKCPVLKKTHLRYSILNINNKAIRKGSFMGESIQLNLFLIPDGSYFFNLFNDQGTEITLPFVKKALQ